MVLCVEAYAAAWHDRRRFLTRITTPVQCTDVLTHVELVRVCTWSVETVGRPSTRELLVKPLAWRLLSASKDDE
jgi:hypothetical protein